MKSIIAAATIFAGTARGQSYGGPPNTPVYRPKGSGPSVPHVRVPGQYADPYPEAPIHYADDHRQCKSGGAPCCTAHFERKSGYGKSYTMEPAFNQQLFMDECPAKKTDEAICEAAAKKFTKVGTSLGQKTDYHPKGFVYKKPRKPVYAYEAEDVAAAEAAVTEYKKEIFRVDDPLIVKGEWWSDTKADIAVITTGCCSNVFPDLKAGDKLDVLCENDVIGDPNDLYNLGRYSVVTPGRLRFGCTGGGPGRRRLSSQSRRRLNVNRCAVPFSMIIGGTFERGVTFSDFLPIAVIEATPVQYWAGIGVAALGSISDEWDELNAGSNPGQRTILSEDWQGEMDADPEEIISLAEREDSIAVMEARVCAYSDLLSSLERTEGATVGNTPGQVEIDCSAGVGSGTCVVDLDAEVFTELVTNYMITLGTFDQLVVNVWRTEVSISGSVPWTVDPNQAENRAVIWNFQETESFYFDIQARGVEVDWVLPRATNVSIKADQFYNSMSVLLGKRESYVDLEGNWDDRRTLQNPLPLPPAEPKITLCSCLCPQEDCYHR